MQKKLGPGCTNGEVLRSLDTAGFIMTEVAYAPMSRLSEHAHDNAHFCFVLEGSYTESHNRKDIECKPATLTYRPPGEAHQDWFHNQKVRVFTIEIPPMWIEKLNQDSIYLARSIKFQDCAMTRISKRIFTEFYRMDTAAGLIIEGLTLEMMAETARHSALGAESTIPYWLKKTKELIEARYTENLTLEQIAAEVGVHPVHLASVFRRKYCCTVGEYIRELRIEYACRALKKRDVSLSIIALETGFANQGHFSSTFKRMTGLTPAQYRNRALQS